MHNRNIPLSCYTVTIGLTEPIVRLAIDSSSAGCERVTLSVPPPAVVVKQVW